MIDILGIIEEYLVYFLFILPFFSQIGIPVGLTFFLMLYGSSVLNLYIFFISILILALALLCADLIAYFIGRKFGEKILSFFSKNKSIKKQINRASKLTKKNGFYTIYLTRTVLLGLSPITNYILGIEKYSLRKFTILVFSAELIFSFIFMGIGFYFSDTWELILSLIKDFSYILIISIIIFNLIKYLVKIFKD